MVHDHFFLSLVPHLSLNIYYNNLMLIKLSKVPQFLEIIYKYLLHTYTYFCNRDCY